MERMGTPAHRPRYTYREYLMVEQVSTIKHEFLEGEIYAMAGGTPGEPPSMPLSP